MVRKEEVFLMSVILYKDGFGLWRVILREWPEKGV